MGSVCQFHTLSCIVISLHQLATHALHHCKTVQEGTACIRITLRQSERFLEDFFCLVIETLRCIEVSKSTEQQPNLWKIVETLGKSYSLLEAIHALDITPGPQPITAEEKDN